MEEPLAMEKVVKIEACLSTGVKEQTKTIVTLLEWKEGIIDPLDPDRKCPVCFTGVMRLFPDSDNKLERIKMCNHPMCMYPLKMKKIETPSTYITHSSFDVSCAFGCSVTCFKASMESSQTTGTLYKLENPKLTDGGKLQQAHSDVCYGLGAPGQKFYQFINGGPISSIGDPKQKKTRDAATQVNIRVSRRQADEAPKRKRRIRGFNSSVQQVENIQSDASNNNKESVQISDRLERVLGKTEDTVVCVEQPTVLRASGGNTLTGTARNQWNRRELRSTFRLSIQTRSQRRVELLKAHQIRRSCTSGAQYFTIKSKREKNKFRLQQRLSTQRCTHAEDTAALIQDTADENIKMFGSQDVFKNEVRLLQSSQLQVQPEVHTINNDDIFS